MSFEPYTAEVFAQLVGHLGAAGYAEADIAWSENCAAPQNPEHFASEAIFVICNSGMKNTVARQIYDRCMTAIARGESVRSAFGHDGKAAAIDKIWGEREAYFAGFMAAADQVAYCETLPWIGGITKYHLAKNFGAQVAKPDVHLQRLADLHGCSAQDLCQRLAELSGYKVATVDLLLWRACAVGIIESRTGRVRPFAARQVVEPGALPDLFCDA